MIDAVIKPVEMNVEISAAAADISIGKQLAPIPDNYIKYAWNGEYIELLKEINNTPFIVAPTEGKNAIFYDRDIPNDYMGVLPEFVQNVYSEEYTLTETGFPAWAASTTAGVIVASKNLPVIPVDMETYEYLIRWRFKADFEYLNGVTEKAIPLKILQEHIQILTRRPSTLANVQAGLFNANSCLTAYTIPVTEYRTTGGALSLTWAATYGIYTGLVAATFASTTANKTNLTIKTPTINARCNSSYFATARKAYVDNDKSKLHLVGDLYRVKRGSNFLGVGYSDIVGLFNEA